MLRPRLQLQSEGGGPPRTTVTHKVPFQAHDNTPAFMLYHGLSPPPPTLPYLYQFSTYITTPGVSPDTFDGTQLYEVIMRRMTYVENYRLDLYFLPNATVEDCIAHYNAEKAGRGTITRQIEAVERRDPPSNAGGLPGMVPSYLSVPYYWHHDVLLLSDQDWRTDGMLLVRFNRASIEDAGVFKEELDDYPPTQITRFPVDMEKSKSPDTIQRRIREIMYLEDLAAPYEKAVELGYTTW